MVLMMSCGYEKTQQLMPAKVPTNSPSHSVKCGCSLLTIFSFKNQQAANWAPQAKISRNAVEYPPLNSPFTPSFLNISLAHSLEFLYLEVLSNCMWHLTNSTGETTKVLTSPAKAPFSIPLTRLSSFLLVIFLKNQQEAKIMALMSGTVTRGQQIPLNRCRKPSVLTMDFSEDNIVSE